MMFVRKKIEPNKKSWLEDETNEKNIYSTIRFFMCFSQCMGVLPLDGILKGKDRLQFKWVSFRMLYTFFYIGCFLVAMLFCTASGFENGYNMSTIANQVFYTGALIILILYLRLATVWPTLLSKWCSVDEIMNKKYGYPERVDMKIRLFGLLYLLLAIGDHTLSVANRYYGLKMDLKENYTAGDYYKLTFGEIYKYMDFSLSFGVYTSLITTHANLSWAINDTFIIIVSVLLASRFKQLTNKMAEVYDRPTNPDFWKEIRQDYDRLCDLFTDLNENISLIIMLSYVQNICFILVQIYHSLESFDNSLETGYFLFSSCYLLFKTISVSLYAASINDESKAPATYLNAVPSKLYNPEIKRLLIQISFDTVVLSGCKMFKITRGLVLSIATAIVTYELLLIQLNSILFEDSKDGDGVIPPTDNNK